MSCVTKCDKEEGEVVIFSLKMCDVIYGRPLNYRTFTFIFSSIKYANI